MPSEAGATLHTPLSAKLPEPAQPRLPKSCSLPAAPLSSGPRGKDAPTQCASAQLVQGRVTAQHLFADLLKVWDVHLRSRPCQLFYQQKMDV